MGNKVNAIKYEIYVTDLKTGVTEHHTYGSYQEAVNYYAVYKTACKNCKLEMYVLILEDIL